MTGFGEIKLILHYKNIYKLVLVQIKMRIVFKDLDIFYPRVVSVKHQIDQKYQEGDDTSTQIDSEVIALPFPIRNAKLCIDTNRKGYSAAFGIMSKWKGVYGNSSDEIGKQVRERLGLGWLTLHYDAVGMVLDKDKIPYMTIVDPGEDTANRAIFLGTGGAPRIPLEDYNDFEKHLKNLEELANIAVKVWFDSLVKKGRICKVPDVYFFISA